MTSAMANLFETERDAAERVSEAANRLFAGVAIEQSIDRALDYVVPPRLAGSLQVGHRVRVPLGRKNKSVFGYVVSIRPSTTFRDPTKVKTLLGVDDQRVLVPSQLMELAVWMARYYVTPLGQVLECIIPSAVKKRTGLGYVSWVQLVVPREEAQKLVESMKSGKRRAVLARLLEMPDEEAIDLLHLSREAGVKPPTVRKMAKTGTILITQKPDLGGLVDASAAIAAERAPALELNEDQQKAFNSLLPRLLPNAEAKPDTAPGFSVNLLMGVTGSGKTEVYLQALQKIVDQGRQAIVMVPEIALTPQTAARFTARFPRVAILHSGLSATQRHRYWQQIATGQADVIVGARSAVFAPTPRLGAIVVDEEHESSYKQDQAPRYHGRDVAIKRAQLEQVPILLGSATPSLEMYAKTEGAEGRRDGWAKGREEGTEGLRDQGTKGQRNGEATAHRISSTLVLHPQSHRSLLPQSLPSVPPSLSPAYHLLTLPRRVRGLQLPHVELIDMKQEIKARRGVNLFSQRLEYLLSNTIALGQQAILLLNRRGYSNYIYCPSCQHVMQCKYCDKTLTYHRSGGEHELSAKNVTSAHSGQLHCHYCLAVNALPTECPQCKKHLSLFGLGTQRVEEEIRKKFPQLSFARVDSDTMRSSKDYEALLARFAKKEIQCLVGTQMIAKGLDYPNVTLVGVISGDTALSLPDFRAAERTFQLITQVAGRAGRGDIPGRVVLQTFQPDDPTIQSAIKQDFVGFAERELEDRKQTNLPPFARMVRVILRDENAEKLQQMSEVLANDLADAAVNENGVVTLKGPMPAAVGRIAGYFRYQILLFAPTPAPLQRVLAAVRTKGLLTKAERVAVDVDPVSLL